MGLFTRKEKHQSEGEAGDEEATPASVPPAPSATHLALIAERETAASAHRRAQKAEAAYRVRRRATTARTEYSAAKTQLKISIKSFGSGVKSSGRCIWYSHAVVLEKMRKVENQKEKIAIQRKQSKKEKLSEKVKKMEEEEEKRKEARPAEGGEEAAAE